jgi:hypothetical protein
MIRGNPAATWQQRSRLSGRLHALAPAIAAGDVTVTSRSQMECAWIVLVAALACSAVDLDKYPLHRAVPSRKAGQRRLRGSGSSWQPRHAHDRDTLQLATAA